MCCKRKDKSSLKKKDLLPPGTRGLLDNGNHNSDYCSVSRDLHSSSTIQ